MATSRSQNKSKRPNRLPRKLHAERERERQRLLAAGSSPDNADAMDPRITSGAQHLAYWVVAILVTVAMGTWSYRNTIVNLVATWNTEPDYSHGYLVGPIAVFLLWLRRDSLPKDSVVPGWGGLLLLVASFFVRYAGERLFLVPVASWAMILWLAGVCWLAAGFRTFVWSVPSLLFLMFMVPLPYRIEQSMSWNLQTITTRISTMMLQCLGQPAIAEGHTIYLGDGMLEVEQACSGLRMFMGIAAVAYVFVLLHRRTWWEKGILVAAVAPIAMVSNAIRVVVTGLITQMVSGEAAFRFSHDAAGFAMIAVAATLFWLLLGYLHRLFVEVDIEVGHRLSRRPAAS